MAARAQFAQPQFAQPQFEALARNAWVTLVMRGDAYVPGALALAASLRGSGTAAATVCMVTPDVSAGARALLSRAFDRVALVDPLTYPTRPMPTAKQREIYGGWISDACTKWRCLGLAEYARVIVLDADTVLLGNCDHLFDLPAPAGIFSSPWAAQYAKRPPGLPDVYNPGASAGKKPVRKRGDRPARADPPHGADRPARADPPHGADRPARADPPHGADRPAPVDLPHGAPVPDAAVARGLRESFTAFGTSMLLAPAPGLLEEFIAHCEAVVAASGQIGTAGCFNGADEQMIVGFFLQRATAQARAPVWHHISQRFGDIPWHANWQEGAGSAPAGAKWPADSRILHYHGQRKAWEMRPSEWPDVAIWWRFAAAAIAADPAAAAVLASETDLSEAAAKP